VFYFRSHALIERVVFESCPRRDMKSAFHKERVFVRL